jgi:hypothetical protein
LWLIIDAHHYTLTTNAIGNFRNQARVCKGYYLVLSSLRQEKQPLRFFNRADSATVSKRHKSHMIPATWSKFDPFLPAGIDARTTISSISFIKDLNGINRV